jgi:plastocyanin
VAAEDPCQEADAVVVLLREHARRRGANRTLARRAAVAAVVGASLAITSMVWAARQSDDRRAPVVVAAEPGERVVYMGPEGFSSDRVVVPVGTTVRWQSEAAITHRLTNQVPGGSVTADLGPRGEDAITFDRPGTYQFRCTEHVGMVGTVVVHA